MPKSSIATRASSRFSAFEALAARSGSWMIALSVSSTVSRAPEMPLAPKAAETAAATSSRLIWIGDMLTLMPIGSSHAGGAVPVGERARRRLQRPAAELDDQPRFLGDRDELVGRDHPALVVGPARQRLEAGDAAGLELDQRLVGEGEAVGLDRAAQFGLHAEAAARPPRPGPARRSGWCPSAWRS